MIKNGKQKILIYTILGILVLFGLVFFFASSLINRDKQIKSMEHKEIILPAPRTTGELSVEEALLKRRSIRNFKEEPLNLEEISQLLWAAQGVTDSRQELRTAPSAGALYPLEVYLAVKNVEGLSSGVYRYLPKEHKLILISEGNVGSYLAEAALGQGFIGEAPINLIFSAVLEITTTRYGKKGVQYVYMEAGHAAQNVYLQAESLKLGTVVVGAFNEERIREILKTPEEEMPLYIIPVGKR